jgi:uncharacterized protein YggE
MRIGFALMAMLVVSSLQADDYRQLLTVSGHGKVKVMATLSDVDLAVEVQAHTAPEVQEALAKKIQPVVAFLKNEQVERLQTSSHNIYPQYAHDSANAIVGFTGYSSISFSSTIDRVGSLIDGAIQAGANRVNSVAQRPDDAALQVSRDQAIQQAIQQAMQQARTTFAALGLKQRHIARINLSPPGQNYPQYHAFKAMGGAESYDMASSTEVLPQEQDVEANVSLDIEFE